VCFCFDFHDFFFFLHGSENRDFPVLITIL
jgi:hypothetical protein